MTIRTLIIDDEADARFALRNYLQTYCEEVEILEEIATVERALAVIPQHEPDLVFLDVRLSPGSGFDILERLDATPFAVIFVTAYDEYALRAIRFSALDYLLKPIDPDELEAAVGKVRQGLNQNKAEADPRISLFKSQLQMPQQEGRIVLPTMEGFVVRDVKSIVRCEAERNYTHFFFVDGSKMLIPKTLKVYDELLCDLGFFRVHQSHLLNLKQIVEYKRRKKGGIAHLINGEEIPVSESRKEGFMQHFLR
ncbi:MAG: LytTR family DNA-binding domain-containing protein [Bacteroidota bacterium]